MTVKRIIGVPDPPLPFTCDVGNHEAPFPYKTICGPCRGRECGCRKLKGLTLQPCDVCGEGHELRCCDWACEEHYAEIKERHDRA